MSDENLVVKTFEKSMHSDKMFKLFSIILRLTPKPLLERIVKEWSKYKKMPLIPKERL